MCNAARKAHFPGRILPAAILAIGVLAGAAAAHGQAEPPLLPHDAALQAPKPSTPPALGSTGSVVPPRPDSSPVPPTPVGVVVAPQPAAAPAPAQRSATADLQNVQHAWSVGVPAPEQDRPGVKRVAWDGGGVVRVTTRRYVYTTIVLPPCEVIEQVLMGDPVNFAFRLDETDAANPGYRPARNRVDIVPRGEVGIDTTATLITASGRIYPFYLVATDVDSPDIPDVVVQVQGPRLCGVDASIDAHVLRRGATAAASAPDPGVAPGVVQVAAPAAALPGQRGDASLARPPGFPAPAAKPEQPPTRPDYLRKVPVEVQDLHFDTVQILVPNESSRAIAPLRVYDDGRWTYIDFGVDRIDSMRLPQPYLVEDGVDHLVNTALAGEKGEILIVKAIGDLALKSGRLYVCLPRRRKGLDAVLSAITGGGG